MVELISLECDKYSDRHTSDRWVIISDLQMPDDEMIAL